MKNVGNLDRVIRILLAIVVFALYFMNIISGVTAIVLMFLAGILMFTSIIRFCPLYLPFKFNTGKK